MKRIPKRLPALFADRRGAVMLEFAILAPALLAMLLGVLQIGIGMQNYNALRSVSAELARYAVINAQDAASQSNMTLRDTNDELEQYGRQIAGDPPFALDVSRLTVTVTSVPTRVDGASERTIVLNYNIPSVLGVIGVDTIPISYSRPVFIT